MSRQRLGACFIHPNLPGTLALTVALVMACSGGENGEEVSTRRQGLTEGGRILGYEAPTSDWSSPQATIGQSSHASQGEHSLSLTPSGWTEINSVPLSSLESVGDHAYIDVRLSAPLQWGEVRLIVKIPSEGIWWAELGQGRSLAGLAPGAFHTLEFPLSGVRSALNSTYSDLQITVAINADTQGVPLLIDNLRFDQAGLGTTLPVERWLELSLPVDADASHVALAGSNAVLVGSQSVINGQLTNAGESALELQASVATGTIYSTGPLLLRERASIDGDAVTASTAELQNDVTITGSLLENALVPVGTVARWSVRFPTSAGDTIQLEPDTVQVVAPDPANLLTLNVQPRARAILRSGQYYFKSIHVGSEGVLEIDDTETGPVVLYVEDGFDFQGAVRHPWDGTSDSVAAPQLLVVHLGSSPVYVRSPFRGTLFAPEASVVLATYDGVPHEASFIGDSVVVQGAVRVNVASFQWPVLEELRPRSAAEFGALNVLLPKGVSPARMLVGARRDLRVEQSAELSGSEDQVSTAAEGQIVVETARTTGLVALRGATLGTSAQVTGDVLSLETSTVAEGAVVSGQVLGGQALSPPDSYAIPFIIPPPDSGDLLIRAGRSRIVWPGDYRDVVVEGGGRIYIQSGEYRFNNLEVRDGAEVVVSTHQGPIQAFVSGGLDFGGEVRPLGQSELRLFLGYTGAKDVTIRGKFRGALVAPRATLFVTGGEHEALFYGDTLNVSGAARISSGYAPWEDVLPTVPPMDEVFVSDVRGGVLNATDSSPGELNLPEGFELRIPRRLPVQYGNAGNHQAELTYRVMGGSIHTCTYRGGASVSHPRSLLELAKGRAYHFESCSDGSEPGAVHLVDYARLAIQADPQAEGGVTRVTLGVGDSCEGLLEQPIPVDVSREMIESFSWPSARVPERTAEGRPTLYYANIYITNEEELERLHALLIHWQTKPLFDSEFPEDWEGSCGTIGYDSDGEGLWVYAVLPGATYNALLDVRSHPDVPADQRELFRAVKLRPLPPGVAEPDGSIKYSVLEDAAFRYMGLTEFPDDVAIEVEVFPGKKGSVDVVDGLKWVFERGKDFVLEVGNILGVVDEFIFGSVTSKVRLSLVNLDPRFRSSDPEHANNARPILRAWGDLYHQGKEMVPQGAKVTLFTRVIRPPAIVALTVHQSTVGSNGMASFKVGKGGGGLRGDVRFGWLCYENQTSSGFVTSWLLPNETCISQNPGFGAFIEDRTTQVTISNTDLWMLNEMTDSASYFRNIMGGAPRRAKLLTGLNAYAASGFEDLAWTPCFGFGNLFVELVHVIGGPFVATAIGNADIIVNRDYWATKRRGLVSHEYGHFALCSLANEHSGKVFTDVVMTLDTIAAGPGNPGPDDQARVMNEAFADFFSGQVAGATSYFVPPGSNDHETEDERAKREGMAVSVAPPGLDYNFFSQADGADAIGRLATMYQDLFDGGRKFYGGPTSGDAWSNPDPTTPWIRPISLDLLRTDGDTDPEAVRLPGTDIHNMMSLFFEESNFFGAYRFAPMHKAVARSMLETGVSWCQACLLMAPHFVAGFETNDKGQLNNRIRDIIETCVSNATLRDLLGNPPHSVDTMNGHTCEPCGSGRGMAPSGGCIPCPIDVSLNWADLPVSQETETCPPGQSRHFVPWSSAPSDICPSQFIVEIVGARSGNRLKQVKPSVSTVPATKAECEAHELRSLITQDTSVSSYHVPGRWVTSSIGDIDVEFCNLGGGFGNIPNSEDVWPVFTVNVDADLVRVRSNSGPLRAALELVSACPGPVIR